MWGKKLALHCTHTERERERDRQTDTTILSSAPQTMNYVVRSFSRCSCVVTVGEEKEKGAAAGLLLDAAADQHDDDDDDYAESEREDLKALHDVVAVLSPRLSQFPLLEKTDLSPLVQASFDSTTHGVTFH